MNSTNSGAAVSFTGDAPGPAGTGSCGFPVLNLTDEALAQVYVLSFGSGLMVLFVMLAVLAVGLPGNLAFLVAVYRLPEMRTPTNAYLTSLAAVDLSFLVVGVVTYCFYFTGAVRSHLRTAQRVGCVGAFAVPYFAYFLSVCTVTLVTADKHSAVCRPLVYAQRSNGRRARWLIAASYPVAGALAGLVMLRFGRLERVCAAWPDGEAYRDLPVLLGYCVPVSPAGLVVGHLLELAVFLSAVASNAVMYGRIVARLGKRVSGKRRQSPASPASSAAQQQAVRVRNQVARLLITFGTVSFLCQAPSLAVSLAGVLHYALGSDPAETYRRLALPRTVGHLLVFLNSAVNPVIYSLTSRVYRQAFRRAVPWPPACRGRNLGDRRQPRPAPAVSAGVPAPDNLGFQDFAQASELGLTDPALANKI